MRIAIATWNNRRFGGVESYLDTVIPGLAARGHELALVCEVGLPVEREEIASPAGSPTWCSAIQGEDQVIAELRRWQPELIFSQGLTSIAIEERVRQTAPTVFYGHNYYGGCISGAKSFGFPQPRPCARQFGWQCLIQYYPRRCGGLNPAVMRRLYTREIRHRNLLASYDAIVTGSDHMRRQYQHSRPDHRSVRMIPQPVANQPHNSPGGKANAAALYSQRRLAGEELRLLFSGRMVKRKGGAALIRALPLAAQALKRRVRLTLAGDGPERQGWMKLAAAAQTRSHLLSIEFPGWLASKEYDQLIDRSHLMVMPSWWPEPFGRAGLEAGVRGVPAAAFAVGGIPEWLTDGTNGHLASGEPPTVGGLADAISRCLADGVHYADLCEGALARTRDFPLGRHLDQLTALFAEVIAR